MGESRADQKSIFITLLRSGVENLYYEQKRSETSLVQQYFISDTDRSRDRRRAVSSFPVQMKRTEE